MSSSSFKFFFLELLLFNPSFSSFFRRREYHIEVIAGQSFLPRSINHPQSNLFQQEATHYTDSIKQITGSSQFDSTKKNHSLIQIISIASQDGQ
jgi:hypothetical protein